VPPLRPHENGVRFLLTDAQGTTFLDVTVLPGLKDAAGVGWVARPTAWTWRSPTGVDGSRIFKAKILGSGPGQVAFKVIARNASFPVTAGDLPLAVTVVFSPPLGTAGQCGEARFPGPAPAPACEMDATGSRVRCR
jgi:hypothetical protein